MLDYHRLVWKQAFISVFKCLKKEVEILFVFDQLWGTRHAISLREGKNYILVFESTQMGICWVILTT